MVRGPELLWVDATYAHLICSWRPEVMAGQKASAGHMVLCRGRERPLFLWMAPDVPAGPRTLAGGDLAVLVIGSPPPPGGVAQTRRHACPAVRRIGGRVLSHGAGPRQIGHRRRLTSLLAHRPSPPVKARKAARSADLLGPGGH